MDPASSSLAVVMRYPEAEQTNTTGDDVSKPQRKVEICPSRDNRHSRRARVGELNAALVGAGNLARWVHLPVLKGMSGTNVRAGFSNSGVRGKNYSLRFGATYCTSNYEEIL